MEAVVGDGDLSEFQEALGNLFLPGPPAVSEFAEPLKDRCRLVRHCSLRSQKHFHNGDGKLFMFELLKMRYLVPTEQHHCEALNHPKSKE